MKFLVVATLFLLCNSVIAKTIVVNKITNINNLVSSCYSCHGASNKSVDLLQSLNGYNQKKFISKFKWFSENAEKGAVMHHIAKGFTSSEIKSMSIFFANQNK
jgi:cytochrome c553